MALPLYEFLIGEEGLGMTAISLVEKPAIESQFIAFADQKPKIKYVKLSDDYKHMIGGLALIPDKLIYRIDPQTKEEYYGFFSADTISKIRDKFHKEKNTSEVNLQHDDEQFIDAYLVESYLLDSEDRVNEVKSRGIDEACLGAWFVTYKIEDDQAFEKAIEGELTGFSVEVMLNRELKLNKNNNKINNNFMNKFNGFLNKFKTLLAEMETEELDEVKLSDAMLADGSKTLRYGNVGEPVNYVIVDDAGVESLELVGEGEYVLESGETLVVDANGNLLEIKAAEVVATPIEAEETKLAEVSGSTETSDMDKKLSELVPLDKDGEYYISVSVYDGKVSYGSMSTWTSLKLKAEQESDEVKALKLKVEELEVKVVAPISNPVEIKTEITPKKVLSKTELSKMTPLERELYKLGLEDFKSK